MLKEKTILTVNPGSSSIRLSAINADRELTRLADGHYKPDETGPEDILRRFLSENNLKKVNCISHRVVHGGKRFVETCLINENVEKEIEKLSPLAPLHNPAALKWIRACRNVLPEVPQAAVFDTAFYAQMPDESRIYALPKELCIRHGFRRYGFHGIAHKAMFERFKKLAKDTGSNEKVISIQLGSGCSITAVKGGLPVDTSMGFSPLEGLMMSTRSGDIDPGVLIYLQKQAGMSVDEIDALLNRSSGLLGVSGTSGDMRLLLGSDEPAARLAVGLYCYRVKKYIGAYMSALGGADAILFGGGVGENSPDIRKKTLENMQWCGIELDRQANTDTAGKESMISAQKSKTQVWVIPVDEAVVMAREALYLMNS